MQASLLGNVVEFLLSGMVFQTVLSRLQTLKAHNQQNQRYQKDDADTGSPGNLLMPRVAALSAVHFETHFSLRSGSGQKTGSGLRRRVAGYSFDVTLTIVVDRGFHHG